MFWDRFQSLCEANGTKPNTVAKALNLSNATCSDWKKNGNIPKGEILINIANYFDVSVDYLLGLSDNPQKKEAAKEIGSLSADAQKTLEYLIFVAQNNPQVLQKLAEYAKFLTQETQ